MALNNVVIKKISIIGDGGWGTTLAIHLSRKKYPVTLWGAFPENIAQIAKSRENKKFLARIKIPSQVRLTSDIDEAVSFGDLIVLSVPSEYLTDTLSKIQNTSYKGKIFVSVVKGIHPESFKRMSEIIHDHLPHVPLVVLSGPTIAVEVAAGIPTTAVAACSNEKLAVSIQKVFNSDTFRIYTNTDVIGVEIGGQCQECHCFGLRDLRWLKTGDQYQGRYFDPRSCGNHPFGDGFRWPKGNILWPGRAGGSGNHVF